MTATQEVAVAAPGRPAPVRPPRRLLPTKRTRFHLLLMTPAILLGLRNRDQTSVATLAASASNPTLAPNPQAPRCPA